MTDQQFSETERTTEVPASTRDTTDRDGSTTNDLREGAADDETIVIRRGLLKRILWIGVTVGITIGTGLMGTLNRLDHYVADGGDFVLGLILGSTCLVYAALSLWTHRGELRGVLEGDDE